MKCPACSNEVLWRWSGSSAIELFDKDGQAMVGEYSGDVLLSVGIKATFSVHKCPMNDPEPEKDDDELRAEFWEHARIVGLLYACPACMVGAQERCRDMRYSVKEHVTEWPHKERFMPYLAKDILDEARKKRWLS